MTATAQTDTFSTASNTVSSSIAEGVVIKAKKDCTLTQVKTRAADGCTNITIINTSSQILATATVTNHVATFNLPLTADTYYGIYGYSTGSWTLAQESPYAGFPVDGTNVLFYKAQDGTTYSAITNYCWCVESVTTETYTYPSHVTIGTGSIGTRFIDKNYTAANEAID